MARNKKAAAKKIAATGARTVGGAISLCLKTLGTILLIAITTGIIFASIFAVYVKTNLSEGLDIKLEDFKPGLGLSSVILGQNPETGDWEELVTLQSTEYRIWVDYDKIPEDMIQALVSIEDERFYRHHGVDWYRTSGAFVNMFLGLKESSFGGSTITQQLIKNVTQEDEVTIQRKLMEIFRAVELEKEYEKEEILEWYLSVVYFGHGRYGIGAASNYYFGKDVSELSLAECASIIGITNNPSIYSPYVSREKNKTRQELILRQMRKLEYITTDAELEKAIKEKLVFQRGEDEEYEPLVYSWFEEAVIEEVVQDLVSQKGYSEKAARTYLTNGGYRIYSTINTELQAKMDSIYKNLEEIPVVTGSSQQIQSAMIIADPYTGDIVALAGAVGDKDRNLLRSNATRARRPPGSSIKPLSVYGPAMESGLITPDTKFEDSNDIVLAGRKDGWMPHNDDRSEDGVITIRTAIIRSKNTISAQVLDKLTPAVSYSFMTQKLGFKLDAEDENYAALSLGQLNHGATVKEMTSAYTMFSNSGIRTELRTYSKITDAEGNIILEKKTKQMEAISETTAYWITDMLRQAATNGTGYEANLGNMPTAGKTGTTSDKKDRWFAGYTPYYVGVVWTGYEIPAVMTVKGGGNPAAQIWKKVMAKVHEDLEPKEFNKPANTYLPPVDGVLEVGYTIRYVDTDGIPLSVEEQTGVVGREVSAVAMPLPDFILMSEEEKTITLGENPDKNVIEFIYKKDEPEPDPIDPWDPWGPWDPWDPFDPDNTTDPNDTNDPNDTHDPGDTDNPGDTTDPDDTSDPDGPVVG